MTRAHYLNEPAPEVIIERGDPLHYMLEVLRDPCADRRERIKMAKAAAPYFAALSNTQQSEIAAAGITPQEYMKSILEDPSADLRERTEMAKALAPYAHQRRPPMPSPKVKPKPTDLKNRNERIEYVKLLFFVREEAIRKGKELPPTVAAFFQ